MNINRRQFNGALLAGLGAPLWLRAQGALRDAFRIRTITAGVTMTRASDLAPLERAIEFLLRAKAYFEGQGYGVQTVRLATQPLAQYLPDWSSASALTAIEAIDRLAAQHGMVCSLGPVIDQDGYDPGLANWVADMLARTERISTTVNVASGGNIHYQAIRCAAEAVVRIAATSAGGEGNFRFAACAQVPSDTPFFPAAYYHRQSFSLGLQSPGLLTRALAQTHGAPPAARNRVVREQMDQALQAVEKDATGLAEATGWHYSGIDVSPAPSLTASIGEAIELHSGAPFGSASTLAACAAITTVLKQLKVRQCGYSGLMLPPLEDKVLARRAIEGRYGLNDLLLYSSVCGTGIDVAPLPGNSSAQLLSQWITDTAALAVRYDKPLSARLLPIPGKQAGQAVSFNNPLLADAVVMAVE